MPTVKPTASVKRIVIVLLIAVLRAARVDIGWIPRPVRGHKILKIVSPIVPESRSGIHFSAVGLLPKPVIE
jgi:hypothetical protein